MKRKLFMLVSLLFVFNLVMSLSAQDSPHSYVGVKKCKMCHQSANRGKQYQHWADTKHAQAYATLATDRAKEVAAAAGVEGDPQKSEACLSCHTTGYNAPAELKQAGLTLEEGVSCEACHGPGSNYFKLNIMKKACSGEIDKASVGLITPDKDLCLKCHNEKSPTYKEFDYEKRYAETVHPAKTSE